MEQTQTSADILLQRIQDNAKRVVIKEVDPDVKLEFEALADGPFLGHRGQALKFLLEYAQWGSRMNDLEQRIAVLEEKLVEAVTPAAPTRKMLSGKAIPARLV
jgi:hypothetical protein